MLLVTLEYSKARGNQLTKITGHRVAENAPASLPGQSAMPTN
jgi:hypothetical protein